MARLTEILRIKIRALLQFGKKHRSRAAIILLLVTVAATMALSPLCAYLNNTMFLGPLQRLRATTGTQPHLSSRLRLILVEDRSLKKLGHVPTFAEWEKIAEFLRKNAGYQKIFLLGFHNLEQEVGELGPAGAPQAAVVPGAAAPASAFMIGGAVSYPRAGNLRATLAKDIPRTKLLGAANGASELPQTAYLMAPAPNIWSHLQALGEMGIASTYAVPAGFALGPDKAIPSLALWAVENLRWDGEWFASSKGRLPRSADGLYYIDWIQSQAAEQQSLPVSVFYDDARRGQVTAAGSKALLAKLAGGDIAIFVPEAYTGARFIDGPSGPVLSYLADTALINAALADHLVVVPWRSDICLFLWALLTVLLCNMRNVRRAELVLAALLVGELSLCTLLFIHAGWLLPCAPMATLTILAMAGLAIERAFVHFIEKQMLTRDLAMGRLIQEHFIPAEREGQVGPWDYRIVYRPYGAMSGDWIKIFRTPPQSTAPIALLAMGDVVGKGPSAALITAVIASVWQSHVSHWQHPDTVAALPDVQALLADLDVGIARLFGRSQNSTISLVLLTEEKAMVTAMAAPFWLKITASGTMTKVATRPRNPLGMGYFKASSFALNDAEVTPGELLFAFTDGVMDGANAAHNLRQALLKAALPVTTPELFSQVEHLAQEAGAQHVLADDCTMLFVRRRVDDAAQKLAA